MPVGDFSSPARRSPERDAHVRRAGIRTRSEPFAKLRRRHRSRSGPLSRLKGTGAGSRQMMERQSVRGSTIEGDDRAVRLLERDAELDTLSQLWRGALGSRGRLVFLGGEAGAGKTSVASEFA